MRDPRVFLITNVLSVMRRLSRLTFCGAALLLDPATTLGAEKSRGVGDRETERMGKEE